jgi:hypothetical protein
LAQTFPWFDRDEVPGTVTVDPTAIYVEGEDLVSVRPAALCQAGTEAITVGGVRVTQVEHDPAGNRFVFVPPARPPAQGGREDVAVIVTCETEREVCQGQRGLLVATGKVTYDVSLEPQPQLKMYAPVGDRLPSGLDMVVTFTRAMEPATITNRTVFVEGIEGATTLSTDGKTATFKPSSPFAAGVKFRAIVLGGTAGVRTAAAHRELKATLAPNGESIAPDRDTWFFTICADCP